MEAQRFSVVAIMPDGNKLRIKTRAENKNVATVIVMQEFKIPAYAIKSVRRIQELKGI